MFRQIFHPVLIAAEIESLHQIVNQGLKIVCFLSKKFGRDCNPHTLNPLCGEPRPLPQAQFVPKVMYLGAFIVHTDSVHLRQLHHIEDKRDY